MFQSVVAVAIKALSPRLTIVLTVGDLNRSLSFDLIIGARLKKTNCHIILWN